jgi:hypothetical protein
MSYTGHSAAWEKLTAGRPVRFFLQPPPNYPIKFKFHYKHFYIFPYSATRHCEWRFFGIKFEDGIHDGGYYETAAQKYRNG